MAPMIQAGDYLLADKMVPADEIKRSDVIVFRSEGPDTPLFVMRVVGLSGDTVEIKQEHLNLNGNQINDRFASFHVQLASFNAHLANYGPEKVPDRHFFVLGDSRRSAIDSRSLGFVPFSDYYAKARVIYWSRSVRPSADQDVGSIRWHRVGTRLD